MTVNYVYYDFLIFQRLVVIKYQKPNKFDLFQIKVNIERPSSLAINNVIYKGNGTYRAVLVGWSERVIIHGL